MVEVMEELIELVPLLKSRCLGDDLVVSRVEAGPEPAEHSGDAQVVLVMAVERRSVEHNLKILSLTNWRGASNAFKLI